MISIISDKINKISKAEYFTFDEVSQLKNIMGVYIIYAPNDDVLYIGSTNKFNIRFGTDLKHESTHTFVKKMIQLGGFNNRHEVVSYLKKSCKIRIEYCDTKRESEALEYFLIYKLNPKLNK